MSQPKMLFISQEVTPYLPDTPLSTLSNVLPRKAQEAGYEVRLFMPKYGNINERRNQLHEVIRLSGMNIVIDDTDHPLIIKVATMQTTRMQVYFIDNDDYFERHPHPEGILETATTPEENDERAVFFVRGVAETVKKLRWDPVIIHCTGWLTAMMPVYLKRVFNDDPAFRKAKIVYTLTSDADTLAAPLNPKAYKQLRSDGIADRNLSAIKNKEINHFALNRLAIDHADAIIAGDDTVSSELIEYAEKTGKPFLAHPGSFEDHGPELTDFYASILTQKK